MKLRIKHKLFLTMLVTIGFGVIFMLLAQRYTFERGLLRYIQSIEIERLQTVIKGLTDQYSIDESWGFLADGEDWSVVLIQLSRGIRSHKGYRAAFVSRQRVAYKNGNNKPMWKRLALFDKNHQWLAGPKALPKDKLRTLYLEKEIIGHIAYIPPDMLNSRIDRQFSSHQHRGGFLAALIVLTTTLLATLLLSRSFGKPIAALVNGTNNLIDGNYDARITLSRKDEFGLLAQDFNSLASTLEENRQMRRQWVSDISHELRTPITILQAELESLKDGIRPLDRNAVQSLSDEIQRLNLLVNDLHQLSQSDSGELTLYHEPIQLDEFINQLVERFKLSLKKKNMAINVKIPQYIEILADLKGLDQLFSNLIENALRYTSSGGQIRIAAHVGDNFLQITVEDSAPGVAENDLLKLFDRLYRVDSSRNRETGASGLGLAICEGIVKNHGGDIRARQSTLGGIAIDIKIPTHDDVS
jgi:two-component system sensor histidine kinase BaeS